MSYCRLRHPVVRQFNGINSEKIMHVILKSFLQMMTFQKGPEAIPSNSFLCSVCILINIFVSVTANTILIAQDSFFVTLIRTLLILSLNTFMIWLLLNLRSYASRFLQTSTAFMGCDGIITGLTLILLVLLGGSTSSVAGITTAVLALWSIFIFGFIFHRSFEIRISLGIIGAFLLIMFSYRLSQLLVNSI